MTMAIPSATTGRVSALFWRKPSLALFLLLLGPLMWFGIVYLGSLLTLLWQSFYTFDDFTMSVTHDLTLANLQALFNPANYDIIIRTLTMALSVTVASAILALPMAWYMARYTRGKMKAFFYIAVMLPMWASYIVKAYAWTLLLAKDGVAQWFLRHLGLESVLSMVLTIPAVGGNTPDLPLRGAAAGDSRHCRRLDFYLLPDARRFYRAAAGGAAGVLYRQYGLFPAGGDWQYAHGGGVYPGASC